MAGIVLLRWKRLVILALAIESAGIHLMPAGGAAVGRRLCIATAYLLLLFVAWANRRRISVRIIGAGILLNCVALAIGLGLMPVQPSTLQSAGLWQDGRGIALGQPVRNSKDVLMARDETPAWPLTDSIALNRGWMHYAVSPGDLIVLSGLAAGIVEMAIVSRPARELSLVAAT
jgi:hypothetical protein